MKKDTVEDARSIDILMLGKNEILNKWPGYEFTSTWRRNEKIVAQIGMNLDGFGNQINAIRLTYSITDLHGEKKSYDYSIQLDSTPCHFGGHRWWFICPLIVNGRPCNRRCRIVYQPYGSTYFGCRECHRLSYESRQLHRDSFYEGFAKPYKRIEEMEKRMGSSRSLAKQEMLLKRVNEAYNAMNAFSQKITKRKG